MKLIPTYGAEDVPFGTSADELLRRLGSPVTEQTLDDVDTHPKSRRVLNYVKRGFLVTPEHGVISVDIEAEQATIELWDTPINDMSSAELAGFLNNNGCKSTTTSLDSWGEQDVEALSQGIIASFCEGTLKSIEVHDPSWRQLSP